MSKDEKNKTAQSQEVDEYTAKMDRMVNNLKKRSKEDHKRQVNTMLIWLIVGTVIIIASIYLMLNTIGSGFEGAANLFS